MIYEYEAEVLRHINNAVPEIKEASYGVTQKEIEAMVPVKSMPFFIFYRSVVDWTFQKTYKIFTDELKYARFLAVQQDYKGKIYVETTNQAMNLSGHLKFYWDAHSYIYIPFFNEILKVALRLLYIKIDEERLSTDEKGPLKFVEFGWSSQLFLDCVDLERSNVVERVDIFMDNEGVRFISNNKVLKVIKK